MSEAAAPRIGSRLRDDVLPPLLILACALAGWELAVKALDVPPWLLPAPTDIVDRFFKTTTLWYHTGFTVLEALAGFLISAVLGISLSAGIVHSRFLERGVFPYVIVSNAIPIIAIIPLLTIWFGFGIAPKIMICCHHLVFPDRHQHDARAQVRRSAHHRIHAIDQRDAAGNPVQGPASERAAVHFRELQDRRFARAGRRRGGRVLQFGRRARLSHHHLRDPVADRPPVRRHRRAGGARRELASCCSVYLERKATRGERTEETQ